MNRIAPTTNTVNMSSQYCHYNPAIYQIEMDPSYSKTFNVGTGEVVYETTGQANAFNNCHLKQLIDERLWPANRRKSSDLATVTATAETGNGRRT